MNKTLKIVDACTAWLETAGGKNCLDRILFLNNEGGLDDRARSILLDAFFTGASAMRERAEKAEAELERVKSCMRETDSKTIRLEMPDAKNGNAFILTFPNGKEEESLDSLRGVIGSMSELLYAKIPQLEKELSDAKFHLADADQHLRKKIQDCDAMQVRVRGLEEAISSVLMLHKANAQRKNFENCGCNVCEILRVAALEGKP